MRIMILPRMRIRYPPAVIKSGLRMPLTPPRPLWFIPFTRANRIQSRTFYKTMSTIPGDNPVCCTIPPVESNYKPKGTLETINGVSTYVAGEKASKKAIVVIMDVFGMVPLTQQGCDILASQGFYVIMPDFLGDQALQQGDVPFDTPEKVEKRNKLFAGAGNPPARATDVVKFGEKLRSEGFTVGSLGFCWGGKVTFLAGASDAFAAVAGVHPSILTPEDAANCRAAIGIYPSKDEDPAAMEPFVKIAKDYKLYSDAYHGFAAARAKLDEPQYKAACHTAKDLRYALDPLRQLQEQPETEENWDKISRAVQTIAALTRGGAAELESEYVKEIRGFSALILNSMNSERTRLANIAVDLFTVIMPPLGNRFEPFIGVFVPALVKLLGRTNKVFVSRATAALHAIISHCPHPRIFVELRVMASDKSASLRVLVAGAVLRCMTEWDWSTPSLAAKAGDIETVIRALGTDSNVDARKIARQIFEQYKQVFPDRVESFLEPLTPVIKRYLDIKAKPSQDKSAPAPRKQAPVPAPQFKAAITAPVPTLPTREVPDQLVEEQPRPKMTRVGMGRPGPSRAPIADSHAQAPTVGAHTRMVSGPERIMTQPIREHAPDAHAPTGPMRAAVAPSTSSAPVIRSVSSSGPSRMRVDNPTAPYPPSAFDAQPSAHSQPPTGPGRHFRPARAMDPSQMPQRVAVQPPAPKPTVESKKPSGPSRVNLGSGVRSVSGPAAAPTRVVNAFIKTDHPLTTSLTAPSLSASADESEAKALPDAPPLATEPIQAPVLNEPIAPLPSPTAVAIPPSAPVSRPTSTLPPESRPPSVASNATSKAPTIMSISADNTPALDSASKALPAAAPAKPTLTTSKSAPITTKVSALIKRGNPYAPPPFVPKRAPASGGVGAGTASQMTRQREAIAAREKREADDAVKKAKREVGQKKEPKEGKKPASSNAAASSRPRSASSSSRAVPAAPRKRTVSTRGKPPGGPPKVDIKTIEPEMIAAVCAPLPGSPTPLATHEVLHPLSSTEGAETSDNVDTEVMVLDAEAERDVEMEHAVQESATEPEPAEAQRFDVPLVEPVSIIPEVEVERVVIEISDDSSEVDMDEHQEPDVQTPPRTTPVSLIDQTPAPVGTTTPPVPPTGFAFHPQLAQFMTIPPQPIQEAEDFLVDLTSPQPKERPAEKESSNRVALADRGNTHTYLSQFTQDLMTLSGL
ncbi:unnamed protein product [Rhizoctonia solani]|uniref:TOG domain-containing protein n=1 Tax=Rhizoctonia solani TaxID=456999 RepID=A0A8H3E7M2_9AGAM|nr:unnamed protein product [Rhizoctonia solani]